MKIQLYGHAELVTSVAAEESGAGLLLIINTRWRGVEFHRTGSSLTHLFETDASSGDFHDCIEIRGARKCCQVVFVPESEQEKDLLSGVAYSMQDDDQVIFVKIRKGLEQHQATLGEYRSEPSRPAKPSP